MKFCVSCGHELGVGRFCTNCGHPVDRAPTDTGGRTDTAERPAIPSSPRFPLFADEVEEQPPAPPPYVDHRGPRAPWGMWALVAIALIAVAGLGIWLMSDGDDPASTTHTGSRHSASSAPETPERSDSEEPPASADPSGVAAGATAEVPDTAPPGQDIAGNPVDYEADNMLDGAPETTWRMPGDGSGQEIVLTLAGETRLRSVGLVNGYAKTAQDGQGRDLDWYHGNRRIERVEWVFDDGSTVTQDLEDTTKVQSVDVDITTTTVTLRLVTVSAPGTGRAARDYTAISEVSLVGGS
jgi:hypothetical protein